MGERDARHALNVDTISAVVAETIIEARKRGCNVVQRGDGHYQITGGPMLVNYYPESKRRSAYVAGTKIARVFVTPCEAVAMAFAPPPVADRYAKDGRQRHYFAEKKKMLAIHPFCHWRKCKLSLRGNVPGTVKATIEHVIPLYRGGLDNDNNRKLACEPCNTKRGSDMPELKGVR